MTPAIEAGTPAFRRTSLAIFAGGFGTFMLLYCTQAILPLLAQSFRIGPAASSLTVSLTTGTLAVAMLISGSLAESIGHKRVMTVSLSAASILTLAGAGAGGFDQLLALRFLAGIALSGLPACIIAYLGEEVAPGSVGFAIGLSIGGNAFGGLIGRIGTAGIADLAGWRWALGAVGAVGLVCAGLFWRALPAARRFRSRPLRFGSLFLGLIGHFAEPGLRWLFLVPFLLMGAFVTTFNYLGFRLMQAPFGLTQTEVGALFVVYLPGIFAASWAGRLADRFGRRKILWIGIVVGLGGVLLTLPDNLPSIILGIACVTMGFFGTHSVASSWVARRARTGRAQAASIFLCFYYVGSSLFGTLGGLVYARDGWNGLVIMLAALHGAALAVAIRLWFVTPLAVPEEAS